MQSFVNAHFTSKKLADKLRQKNKESMLHFIFNEKFICVLITYDLDIGDFVLQIPYFPKIGLKENYDAQLCKKVLRDLLAKNDMDIDIEKEVNFVDINFWKMRNVVADKWYQDNTFIIGDAAHQFPPSGGYGLNTGISDAFSLAWRLEFLIKQGQSMSFLKEEFNQERIIQSSFISRCARINYNKVLKCTQKIGLNINNAKQLEFLVANLIPKSLQFDVFNNFMKTGIFLSNRILINNLKKHLETRSSYINLVFPYLDYALNFLDGNKNEITKYESILKLEQFVSEMDVGRIIPNFAAEPQNPGAFGAKAISIREYFNNLNREKYEYIVLLRIGGNWLAKLMDSNFPESIRNNKLLNSEGIDFKLVLLSDSSNKNGVEENEKVLCKEMKGKLKEEKTIEEKICTKLLNREYETIKIGDPTKTELTLNYSMLIIRPDFIVEYMQ